jgi:hypothetical protein
MSPTPPHGYRNLPPGYYDSGDRPARVGYLIAVVLAVVLYVLWVRL